MQFVIIATVLVMLPMALVQVSMYFHARNVAAAAARHGLEATRVPTGTDTAGQSTAEEFLDQSAGPLGDATVTATRGTETASVTVTGTIDTVIPGVTDLFEVDVTVNGPVERFEP